MEYLIVDGYNIINAWDDIFDLKKYKLEDCRDKLLGILSNYQGYKKIQVMVVFDAHMVKGSQEKREQFDNLTVVYTKENETADSFIEKYVYKTSSEYTMRVATSDSLIQTTVLSIGGVRMSPRELKEEVEAANRNIREEIRNDRVKTNTLMSRISPELLEKLEKIRRDKS